MLSAYAVDTVRRGRCRSCPLARRFASSRYTGIVVDVGAEGTSAVPIYDGFVLQQGASVVSALLLACVRVFVVFALVVGVDGHSAAVSVCYCCCWSDCLRLSRVCLSPQCCPWCVVVSISTCAPSFVVVGVVLCLRCCCRALPCLRARHCALAHWRQLSCRAAAVAPRAGELQQQRVCDWCCCSCVLSGRSMRSASRRRM